MDAPHPKIDPLRDQRFAPRNHVLIDAVDQRAIEIEKERVFRAASNGFSGSTPFAFPLIAGAGEVPAHLEDRAIRSKGHARCVIPINTFLRIDGGQGGNNRHLVVKISSSGAP